MEQYTPVRFHEKGQQRTLIEIARQYSPYSALREFITNSIDAKIPDVFEEIVITLNPEERAITISDNGCGMNLERLSTLQRSVGYSDKAGIIDKRGEKGLGILAFGSLGNIMHLITRQQNESVFYHTKWEIHNNEKIRALTEPAKLDPATVQKRFYGSFPHGTRVIIYDINKHIMNLFTLAELRKRLGELYTPILRRGEAEILIGRYGKRTKTEEATPLLFEEKELDPITDTIIPVKFKSRGEEYDSQLEALILINPEGLTEKVRVYSKDVLVYNSLAELDEFKKSRIWTSGKVTGYFNDQFSKLVLGREGINRETNAFKAWYNEVRRIEEGIEPILEKKIKRVGKTREDTSLRKVWHALVDAYKFPRPGIEDIQWTKSSQGELRSVKGHPPSLQGGGKRKTLTGEREEEEVPGIVGREGPGTYVETQDGIRMRVVPKRNVPFGMPLFDDFKPGEEHLRSKLEDKLGSPMCILNRAHPDYTAREKGKEEDYMRYVADLCSKEMALCRIKKAQEENIKIEDPITLVLRIAEDIYFNALKNLGLR